MEHEITRPYRSWGREEGQFPRGYDRSQACIVGESLHSLALDLAISLRELHVAVFPSRRAASSISYHPKTPIVSR